MLKLIKFVAMAIGGLVIIFIAIGVIAVATSDTKKPAAVPAAATSGEAPAQESRAAAPARAAEPPPTVSAHEIAQAYEQNTVAADQRFKGRRYRVQGTVADINTDLFGNPYLTLRGGVNQFMEPQFKFDKDALSSLANLRKGVRVTLECTGAGDIAKTPMSDDCALL
jgi:hypothetical protein